MHANDFDLDTLAFKRVTGCEDCYRSKSFASAVDTLCGALRRGAGTLLLTGDAGVGKSSLITVLEGMLVPRTHLARFDPKIFSVRHDGQPSEDWFEARRLQEARAESAAWIAQAIRGAPESSTSVLVAVDDAGDLSDVELAGLLSAANRLRRGTGTLQVLLVGGPDLEARLRRPALAGSTGRIATACRLDGLATKEVGHYVEFALASAGRLSDASFTREAIASVAEHSRGTPRLVNNICGAALLIACESNDRPVTRATVEECLPDLLLPACNDSRPGRLASAPSHRVEQIDPARADSQLELNLDGLTRRRRVEDFEHAPAAAGRRAHAMPPLPAWTVPLARAVSGPMSRLAGSAWARVLTVIASAGKRWPRLLSSLRWDIPSRWADTWQRRVRSFRGRWIARFESLRWRRLSHIVSSAPERLLDSMHQVRSALRAGAARALETARRRRHSPRSDRYHGRRANEGAMSLGEILAYIKSNRAMVGQLSFAFGLFLMAVAVWGLVLNLHASRTSVDDRIARSPNASAGASRSGDALSARAERTADTPATSLAALGFGREATSSVLSGVEVFPDGYGSRAPMPNSTHRAIEQPVSTEATPGDARPGRDATLGSATSRETSDVFKVASRGGIVDQESVVPVSTRTAADAEARKPPHPAAPFQSSAKSALQVSVAKPKAERGTEAAAVHESKPREKTYTVEAGDTLWGIARHRHTSLDALRAANGLGKTAVIHPGQRLIIPMIAKQSDSNDAWHTVTPGENLFRIAKRYGVSVAELQDWNDLTDRTNVVAGQRLRVRAASETRMAMTEPQERQGKASSPATR